MPPRSEAGCTFRLTGADIEAVGISRVPNYIVAFLKHNRDAVYAFLGGTAQDEPYLALIESLGVEVVYCTADAAAAAAVDEVIADAGDRPIALDVETTPLPAYVVTKPLLLTVRGRPYKRQPRDKDRNAAGLDPLRSCVRLVQLYGGGARAAVIDMHHVSWPVLEPLWTRPLVAHNAAFELSFLQHRGIVADAHCTQQAVGLLRGIRRNKPWSLAEASSIYLGLDVEKGHQTSDWGAARLSRGQTAYAAADAVLAHRVWRKVAPALKELNRLRATISNAGACRSSLPCDSRGVGLDVDAHADLCTRRAQTLADARREWVALTGLAPPTVGDRPAIAAYLRDALPAEELASWPTTETGSELSTAEAVLKRAAYLPAMRPLLKVLEAEKWLSTFGPSFLNMLNPVTAASTRSISCREPSPGDGQRGIPTSSKYLTTGIHGASSSPPLGRYSSPAISLPWSSGQLRTSAAKRP